MTDLASAASLAEEVRALTERYYVLIGPDHHKDRDCHWHVTFDWKYGDGPEITVSHDGYIHEWPETSVKSFREALEVMRSRLIADIDEIEGHRND